MCFGLLIRLTIHMDRPGEGTQGGIWYSINMTLVWAAARYRPAMAKDEWRRMLLANHARHYPTEWGVRCLVQTRGMLRKLPAPVRLGRPTGSQCKIFP